MTAAGKKSGKWTGFARNEAWERTRHRAVQPVGDSKGPHHPLPNFKSCHLYTPFVRRRVVGREEGRRVASELEVLRTDDSMIDQRRDGRECRGGPATQGEVSYCLQRDEGAVMQDVCVIKAGEGGFGEIGCAALKRDCWEKVVRGLVWREILYETRAPGLPRSVPREAATSFVARRAPTTTCAK